MRHVSLPAKIASGENKDKPSIVQISSAKITRKDENNKDVALVFEIPAEKFSYPQFGPEPAKDDKGNELELTEDQAKEALDEMVKDAGGVIRLVENYNDATRTASLNKGKNYIRTKETGEPDAIVIAGLAITHDFTWAAAERITNKAIADEAKALADEVDTLDLATLKQRLLAMVGKKAS